MLPKRGGFTLIELSFVLAIIALLSALAVPGYQFIVRRARVAEARALMDAIAHAELTYFRDHGKFLACAPSADAPPRGVNGKFDATRAGWSDLGVEVDGPVRYQYEVALDGPSFRVLARGDLDGDGESSLLTLHGKNFAFETKSEVE